MKPSSPLAAVDDDVTRYFKSLDYKVDWDFNRRSSAYWYEICDSSGGLICQIGMGVPLTDIIEDLTAMAAGLPGTSKSDYIINAKEGCSGFQTLLKRVAAMPR